VLSARGVHERTFRKAQLRRCRAGSPADPPSPRPASLGGHHAGDRAFDPGAPLKPVAAGRIEEVVDEVEDVAGITGSAAEAVPSAPRPSSSLTSRICGAAPQERSLRRKGTLSPMRQLTRTEGPVPSADPRSDSGVAASGTMATQTSLFRTRGEGCRVSDSHGEKARLWDKTAPWKCGGSALAC